MRALTFEQTVAEHPDDIIFHPSAISRGITLTHIGEVIDINEYDGPIEAALELIELTPSFGYVDTENLERALGQGIHVRIEIDDESSIIATNPSYDPTEQLSTDNFPVSPGHLFEATDGRTMKYIDWSTSGPLFEVVVDDPEDPLETYQEDDLDVVRNLLSPSPTIG